MAKALIILLLVTSHHLSGQSLLNGDFNQRRILIYTEHPVTDTSQWDTLHFPIDVRATEDCYRLTTNLNSEHCRSTPGCIAMTPFYISSGFLGSSCVMLELNEPLKAGTSYVITAYLKPLNVNNHYPPNVNFGIKLSSVSIAPPSPQIILRDPWRKELDSLTGVIEYIPWQSFRGTTNNPLDCPDWNKYEFIFTSNGGERYAYISIFGKIPEHTLWDVRSRITRLARQYNDRHNPKRIRKTIIKLRELFPFWPPEEVSDLELVYLASSWRYTIIADASFLIDDVSIAIKK